MIVGSKLSCMGIIGDGCGGGREFIIEDNILYAYDELTKEKIILLKDIHMPRAISKSACIITIECVDEVIKFDLSKIKNNKKT